MLAGLAAREPWAGGHTFVVAGVLKLADGLLYRLFRGVIPSEEGHPYERLKLAVEH